MPCHAPPRPHLDSSSAASILGIESPCWRSSTARTRIRLFHVSHHRCTLSHFSRDGRNAYPLGGHQAYLTYREMAESASATATTGKSTAAAASASDQPGRPYYENLRTTLRDAIRKKELIDAELAVIEDRIFREESSYLEDTAGAGNIVRGFDNWVKGVVVGARGDDRKARSTANRVRDEDRIFSRSSITWLKVSRVQDGLRVMLMHSRAKRTPRRLRSQRAHLEPVRRRLRSSRDLNRPRSKIERSHSPYSRKTMTRMQLRNLPSGLR